MKKLLFSSICALFLTAYGTAQVSTETTIDEKFAELIENSNNFKGYKVVDTGELTTLQNLTSKRIAELKEEIAASKEASLAYKQKIAKQNTDMEALEAKLNQVTAEKDAITFLGFPFSKTSYKSTMWGIVGILILALALFIVRFKKSNVDTKEAKKNLAELEKEFDSYRAKALEKEQRLGRLLQDEKNKQMKLAK
ncbi:hypothetical protein SAMN04488034_10254 [Salinimicrobium catena]|uniref:tRNA (Guanine-N1)-methyltransferase n=1 Tax=Salinimicrobium catena TaxID=390640 RepID=A0A1H5KY27_9FLAO|nr:hypothetical protein [Salinimicrobium catena]SDL03427.1 hypothetical protein SAMN04488140_10254 [Salinimicrobium catena]SEE69769.1 hypothetical protein SAMN04488034_10254 [Salinimicrobium catena]